MNFDSILIANRGEIALRVQRSAQAMGYRTIAVYSHADAGAPHVRAADLAVPIGPSAAGQSYLAIPKLLEAAQRSGAQAVHPGYGFLAESVAFAEACEAAGLVFIGPPPAAIHAMADKGRAKALMAQAGVPCLPGHEGADQSEAALLAAAGTLGFPLMVKAAAGGGGKGMRLVERATDLPEALARARSEAERSFGDGRLILERALIAPRHIEIQIFADGHGTVLALGERDCSVQRRHQKLIEESPSPFVSPDLRARMSEAAVQAARACGYLGAGTVEFLVDDDGAFYFLEMNTRLQVEHPVTEAVTGLDLVEWQIRVARGEPLPVLPSPVPIKGHAIEVRLCAEDPAAGFLPQTGRVVQWVPPPALRCDHALAEGQVIGAHYDPMLAKLIAHGPDRDTARRHLIAGLEAMVLQGVVSNRRYLAQILRDPRFRDGGATTALLQHLPPEAPVTAPEQLLLAAALIATEGRAPMRRFGWSNGPAARVPFVLHDGATRHELELCFLPDGAVSGSGTGGGNAAWSVALTVCAIGQGQVRFLHEGIEHCLPFALNAGRLFLGDLVFSNLTHAPAEKRGAAGDGRVLAPMAGAVIALPVTQGSLVEAGQVVAVLEAMKLEHPLRAKQSGRLIRLAVQVGAQVAARQILAEIEPEDEG